MVRRANWEVPGGVVHQEVPIDVTVSRSGDLVDRDGGAVQRLQHPLALPLCLSLVAGGVTPPQSLLSFLLQPKYRTTATTTDSTPVNAATTCAATNQFCTLGLSYDNTAAC